MDVIEGFQGAAFGMADGIICTLGTIVAVTVAEPTRSAILVAAIASGIANALANSIGFYMSELSERGIQIHHTKRGKATTIHTLKEVVMSGVLSFIATMFVLVALLFPFWLFADIQVAIMFSFVIANLLLFALGAYVAKLSDENMLFSGVKYVILGCAGAGISYFVGDYLRIWLAKI